MIIESREEKVLSKVAEQFSYRAGTKATASLVYKEFTPRVKSKSSLELKKQFALWDSELGKLKPEFETRARH